MHDDPQWQQRRGPPIASDALAVVQKARKTDKITVNDHQLASAQITSASLACLKGMVVAGNHTGSTALP